ncbi:MAG: Mut7-C ubiquitin/RNAse domain-containing protein [Fervidobacterium sp.]|nr:Mut7-C ubiquitin/RNAse domain-containing protein [Fervidobacterium sp.]
MITLRLFGSLCELTNGKYLFQFDPGINQTIKDCIERLGVPHTEVAFITLNKRFVDFSKIVENGDFYCIYPHSLLIDKEFLLTPVYQGEPKFVLDIHLGKLARLLRMFGLYAEFGMIDDDGIVEKAKRVNGIILTRDRKLLMRKDIVFGYIVRSDFPEIQFKEVYHRYSLKNWLKPFTRCIECNGNLLVIDKNYVVGKVPPRVFETHDNFALCDKCGKVYWSGTHHKHMLERINTLLPPD